MQILYSCFRADFWVGIFFETNCGLMIHIDQVASDIKIILKPSQANLVVKLDMQLIEALHMGISADTVQLSILNHPKIKLKSEVRAKFQALIHCFFNCGCNLQLTDFCSMSVSSIETSWEYIQLERTSPNFGLSCITSNPCFQKWLWRWTRCPLLNLLPFVCRSISATMMPTLTFSWIKFRAFQLLKELLSTK